MASHQGQWLDLWAGVTECCSLVAGHREITGGGEASIKGGRSGGFAVAVRSDWHRRGVGQLLMARRSRSHGNPASVNWSGVLHENKPMLNLYRKLGFSIALEP